MRGCWEPHTDGTLREQVLKTHLVPIWGIRAPDPAGLLDSQT